MSICFLFLVFLFFKKNNLFFPCLLCKIMQKLILIKLDLQDVREKRKALKTVSALTGINFEINIKISLFHI